MSFLKPSGAPIDHKGGLTSKQEIKPPDNRRHQPYCWQVALRQSLLPLGADSIKLKVLYITITAGK